MVQRTVLIPFLAGLVLLPMGFSAAAFGETYKTPFAVSCDQIWPAVKAVLADKDHYAKVVVNDGKMKADFQPKHTAHVDISGTLLQRMNHVTLIPNNGVCEMDMVSNYSGWGHNDEGDFRKRVADNLAKGKGEPGAAAMQTAEPAPTEVKPGAQPVTQPDAQPETKPQR